LVIEHRSRWCRDFLLKSLPSSPRFFPS
jgi:hypothetical protein